MPSVSVVPASTGVTSKADDSRAVKVAEAVTQGQPGYRGTDGDYRLCNALSAQAAACECIFITPAAANGYAVAVFSGTEVAFGVPLTAGTVYVVGATSGEIAESTDLVAGQYVTVLGVPTASGSLRFKPDVTGQTA